MSPAPRARVTLPDGQELDVPVLGRERAADGTWWYALRLTLPGPVEVDFKAVYPTVRPVDGESYAGLPGWPAASEATGQWLVSELRRAGEPLRLLHLAGCWQVAAGSRSVTDVEAEQLVAAGARLCDVCMPDLPATWDGRS
jgi:hypothetical protein